MSQTRKSNRCQHSSDGVTGTARMCVYIPLQSTTSTTTTSTATVKLTQSGTMSHLSQAEKTLYADFFLRKEAELGNGDGALTIAEFENLLVSMGFRYTKEQVAAEFIKTDKDQNWKITLDEYLAIMPSVAPPGSPQAIAANIRRRFDENDLNKDGFITFDELKQVLADANHNIAEEELKTFVKDFIKNWDADGDGKIDFEEFVTMFVETELCVDSDCSDDDEEDNVEVEDNGEAAFSQCNPTYIPQK